MNTNNHILAHLAGIETTIQEIAATTTSHNQARLSVAARRAIHALRRPQHPTQSNNKKPRP